MEAYCPVGIVKVKLNSKFYVSTKLAVLAQEKADEYKANQNSERFKELKRQVRAEKKAATKKKIEEAVCKAGGSNAWTRCVDRLCDPAGDRPKPKLVLPAHTEAGLSSQQQVEEFAKHISTISREYQPLEMDRLPARVRNTLMLSPCSEYPSCDDHEVYECLKARKLTSGVEADFHPTVVKGCMPELAHPVAVVFRDAMSTHTWPEKWHEEKKIVIPKVPTPETMDDMRDLGLSTFLNKNLEWFLLMWMWPTVRHFITSDQLGGQPGCGTSHYLARLAQFVYTELEGGNQTDRSAVMAMTVDLSKAFNRLDHNKLITVCYDIGIPICALRLLFSYLKGRTMRAHHNGVVSELYELWGGGPQGGSIT